MADWFYRHKLSELKRKLISRMYLIDYMVFKYTGSKSFIVFTHKEIS